ncbi:MAG: hypothetical protein RR744_00175 [Cellulosilyticaceae bacterium]
MNVGTIMRKMRINVKIIEPRFFNDPARHENDINEFLDTISPENIIRITPIMDKMGSMSTVIQYKVFKEEK